MVESASRQLPARPYPLVDEGLLQLRGAALARVTQTWAAGAQLVQYRNKVAEPDSILRSAAVVGRFWLRVVAG